MQSILGGQGRFIYKNPSKLSITFCKKVAHKIFLNIKVLVEKFTQSFLINIVTHTHHRKLKEPSHRWRQYIFLCAILLYVDQQGAFSKCIEDFLCSIHIHFPNTTCFFGSKRFDGQ